MNKKVAELVERVRLTPEEIRIAIGKFRDSEFRKGKIPELKDYDRAIAEAQLNKVLNDKDLALIDREIPRTGLEQDAKLGRFYWPVIPLAEALKEVKDGASSKQSRLQNRISVFHSS